MNRLIALLAAFFALVLVTGTSLADEMMKEEGSATAVESSIYSGDELLNLTVFNREGEEIGKIADVSKDAETGDVNFVTLVKEGILGVGETKFTLPLNVLDINRDEGKATLLVTEEILANAPIRKEGMSDVEYEELINNHYGIAPAWEGSETKPSEMMRDEKEVPAEGSKY